jgi:hypothetical protein
MKTTNLEMACPWCGRNLDRVSCIDGEDVPEEGDISLCFGCGEWCVFDNGMHLRKPNDEEFEEIGTSPECMQSRWAWTEMRKQYEKDQAAKRSAH